MELFTLKNKTVLITGGSSGIGKECAVICAKLGAKVVIFGRNKLKLKAVISILEGDNHMYFSLDLTKDADKLYVILGKVKDHYGEINGFVHSAGIEMTLPLKMISHEKLFKTFDINVFAGFLFTQLLANKRYINNKASFVFISSIMANVGQVGKVGYCASKGALTAGARAMALELGPRGIRVNSILPGMVRTEMSESLMDSLSKEAVKKINEMHPLGIGNAVEVANACAFLLSDASNWITGTDMVVDGGYSAQ